MELSFRQNGKTFFEQMQSTKWARKPLNVLQRFQSKLNEFNLTSRGERKGFALEKSAKFVDFELLRMVSGLVKMISIIA